MLTFTHAKLLFNQNIKTYVTELFVIRATGGKGKQTTRKAGPDSYRVKVLVIVVVCTDLTLKTTSCFPGH